MGGGDIDDAMFMEEDIEQLQRECEAAIRCGTANAGQR